MLGGENGIIKQAQKAREENKKGEAIDEVYLFWNEAQINYEDTIQQRVELLRERMKEKDSEAIANIEEGEIIVNYKGYDVTISYIDKKIEDKITYFKVFCLSNKYADRIVYLYITKDSKIYIENNNNRICINDKYGDLSEEENIKVSYCDEDFNNINILCTTNKIIFGLTFENSEEICNVDNWKYEKMLDLRTIEDEKYKDKILVNFIADPGTVLVLLNDGYLYQIMIDNKLEKYNLINFPNDTRIKNICIANNVVIFVDQNGRFYNFQGEDLSNSYADGFFQNKNIELISTIEEGQNNITNTCNVFITDDKKAYIYNTNTNQIECLNDKIENLRDKSIINVYNLSNDARLDKNYIVIVTSNGSIYYTEDIINFYNLNIEGFPKFIISE